MTIVFVLALTVVAAVLGLLILLGYLVAVACILTTGILFVILLGIAQIYNNRRAQKEFDVLVEHQLETHKTIVIDEEYEIEVLFHEIDSDNSAKDN